MVTVCVHFLLAMIKPHMDTVVDYGQTAWGCG